MFKVPDPLHFFDDLLLDRVFNPLCWWSEYNYGKDAIHLRGYSIITAIILGLLGSVITHFYLGFICFLVLATLQPLHQPIVRKRWKQNTATGKNILRVKDFGERIVDCFATILMLFLADNLIGMMVLGTIFFLFTIRHYFEATDALPPGYRESKLIFSPT